MKKNLFENAELELILFGSDVLTTSDGDISNPNETIYPELTTNNKDYEVNFSF